MKNLRWAILGASGMLGQEFMRYESQFEIVGFNRENLDVTDIHSIRRELKNFNVVVNCAAWTAVDDAETNEKAAFAVNGTGPNNVASVCAEIGAQLVQISTDYVFDGQSISPYDEDAQTNPQSVYGRTKLAGERAVRSVLPNAHYIVRTAWLYGKYGPNFVKTILNLEKTKDTVSVVNDQFGQPTWTRDLAEQILKLVDTKAPPGTYHATASGQTTWYGFARAIFSQIGADPSRVQPISTEDFPRPAHRPAYSVLGHKKWTDVGITPIQQWEDALAQAIQIELT